MHPAPKIGVGASARKYRANGEAGRQSVLLCGSTLHWCVADRGSAWLDELACASQPWLSAPEQDELASLHRNRASAWLAGRALAKSELLATAFATTPTDISILSLDARGKRNRPEVFLSGHSASLRLSLAHTDQFVAVAWTESNHDIGIDLADINFDTSKLAATWFLPAEQKIVAAGTISDAAIRIWTAKEAAYKAAQSGEAFDPLQIEVTILSAGQGRASYQHQNSPLQTCDVIWKEISDTLVTLGMARN